MNDLDYTKILYFKMFLSVAQQSSFTKAAKTLNVSPTLLTKDISKLEKMLGITLLHRTTRSVSLTTAGEYLYLNCAGIISALENCCQKAYSLQVREDSALSIVGMNTADMSHYLFPIVERYKEEHPNHAVNVTSDYMIMIEDAVLNGEYDIGIIPDFEQKSAEEKGLKWQWWMKEKSQVILPASNPLSRKKSVKLQDLKDATFIVLGGEHKNRYENYLRQIFSKINPHIQLGTSYKNAYTLRDTFFQEDSSVLFTDAYFTYTQRNGFRRISVTDHESGAIAIWKPDNQKAEAFFEWF